MKFNPLDKAVQWNPDEDKGFGPFKTFKEAIAHANDNLPPRTTYELIYFISQSRQHAPWAWYWNEEKMSEVLNADYSSTFQTT
jgi:hypothetical protein